MVNDMLDFIVGFVFGAIIGILLGGMSVMIHCNNENKKGDKR